jgi:hypothetical protein
MQLMGFFVCNINLLPGFVNSLFRTEQGIFFVLTESSSALTLDLLDRREHEALSPTDRKQRSLRHSGLSLNPKHRAGASTASKPAAVTSTQKRTNDVLQKPDKLEKLPTSSRNVCCEMVAPTPLSRGHLQSRFDKIRRRSVIDRTLLR